MTFSALPLNLSDSGTENGMGLVVIVFMFQMNYPFPARTRIISSTS